MFACSLFSALFSRALSPSFSPSRTLPRSLSVLLSCCFLHTKLHHIHTYMHSYICTHTMYSFVIRLFHTHSPISYRTARRTLPQQQHLHARTQTINSSALLCFALLLLLFIFVLNDHYYYFIWNTDFIRLSTIQYGGCLREQHDKYTTQQKKNSVSKWAKPDNLN